MSFVKIAIKSTISLSFCSQPLLLHPFYMQFRSKPNHFVGHETLQKFDFSSGDNA